MSLLNIGLQGLALERDHIEYFEKVIASSKTMKSLREKGNQQTGFKEDYASSIENARKIVEESFKDLELKGKAIKIFQLLLEEQEVISALQNIELRITSEEAIPHAQSKLKEYPALERFFENHMTDGLYLFQF